MTGLLSSGAKHELELEKLQDNVVAMVTHIEHLAQDADVVSSLNNVMINMPHGSVNISDIIAIEHELRVESPSVFQQKPTLSEGGEKLRQDLFQVIINMGDEQNANAVHFQPLVDQGDYINDLRGALIESFTNLSRTDADSAIMVIGSYLTALDGKGCWGGRPYECVF